MGCDDDGSNTGNPDTGGIGGAGGAPDSAGGSGGEQAPDTGTDATVPDAEPEGCASDDQCADGDYCAIAAGADRGECMEGCRTDPDSCDDAKICNPETRTCEAEGCGGDDECADAEYCAIADGENRGECASGCRVDPDNCPDGSACDPGAHACVLLGCGGDDECADEEYCAIEDGADRGECTDGCRVDPDSCEEGQICNADSRDCEIDGCVADGECADNEYCAMDEGAQLGECIEGCRLDPDSCQDGNGCHPGTRVCTPNGCGGYCEQMLANCEGTFPDMAACMQSCALYPADDAIGATGGNSLQCRIYHGGALAADNAEVHCPHAGPNGGGVCGGYCEVYCDLMETNCGDSFPDRDACMGACDNYWMMGAPGADAGDSVQCRIYHAGALAATNAEVHCPHAGADGGGVCAPPPSQEHGEPDARDAPMRLEFHNGRARAIFEIDPEDDTDWFVFGLEEPTDLLIVTHAVGNAEACQGDTIMDFYAEMAEGATVVDDDGGPETCSMMAPSTDEELRAVAAGDHLIRVRSFLGEPTEGPVMLEVRMLRPLPRGGLCDDTPRICGNNDWCNDDMDPPVCVENVCGDGELGGDELCDDGNADDRDGCEACQLVPIGRGDDCEVGHALYVCEEGNFCKPSDDPEGSATCEADECGDGYVSGPEQCDEDIEGCVECRFSPFNGDAEPDDRANPYDLVIGDDGNAKVIFLLPRAEVGIDVDWFEFTTDGSYNVEIWTGDFDGEGCSGDTYLELFADGDEEPFVTDDDDADGPCSRIASDNDAEVAPLAAGTYQLMARTFGTFSPAGANWLRIRLIPLVAIGEACGADDIEMTCNIDEGFCDDELEAPVCVAHVCGDDRITGREECEDGNEDAGDGCEACMLVGIPLGNACDPDDDTYDCVDEGHCPQPENDGDAAVCVAHVCGDGVLGLEEICDDGNAEAGDGCNADCEYAPTNFDAEPDDRDNPHVVDHASGEMGVVFELVADEDGNSDTDWVEFTVAEDSNVLIETYAVGGTGCPGDTIVELFMDGADESIARNDDGGQGNCSRIASDTTEDVRPLAAGVYQVQVTRFGASDVSPTWLAVELYPLGGEGVACDPDDLVRMGCAAESYCNNELDAPVCTAHVCGDGVLYEGVEQCDDEFAGCDDACMFDPFNGDAEPGDADVPYALAFDDFDTARVIFEINPAGDRDWFEFTLDADAEVIIETVGREPGTCAGDTYLELWSDAGEMPLTSNDDGGIRPCSKIERLDGNMLTAGTWRVMARGFSANATYDANYLIVYVLGRLDTGGLCDPMNPYNFCPDGDFCDTRLDAPVCMEHTCGDMWLNEDDEACDDGNDDEGDGCLADCTIGTIADDMPCGDAAVAGAECGETSFCDDRGDTPTCMAHECGDGWLWDGFEQCDNPDDVDEVICTAECEFVGTLVENDGTWEDGFAADEFATYIVEVDEPVRMMTWTGTPDGDCAVDTVITVFDATVGFEEIAQDDDGEGNGCSRLMIDLDTGSYVVRVSAPAGEAIELYEISFEFTSLVDMGEDCDRTGIDNVCWGEQICLMTEDDGDGVCGYLWDEPVPEVEPNHTTAEAAVQVFDLGSSVVADLSVPGEADPEDFFDVFALVLDEPAMVIAETSDGMGGCPGDTRLYRIDGAILDADGVDAAVTGALAENDDGPNAPCSRLEEMLEAGTHYFLVDESSRDEAVDNYVLALYTVPVLNEDERCDVWGVQNTCDEGLECIDQHNDTDGRCLTVVDIDGPGDYAGAIETAGSFDVYRLVLAGPVIASLQTNDGGQIDTCPGIDTQLGVYAVDEDGDWQRILYNDDADIEGHGNCSELSEEIIEAGTYYVLVNDFSNNDVIDAYTLTYDGLSIFEDGGDCDPDGVDGVCRMTSYCGGDGDMPVCTAHICGDSVRWMGEEFCDDGNTDDGDGCSADCELEDGIVEIDGSDDFEDSLEIGESDWYYFEADHENGSRVIATTNALDGDCSVAPDTLLELYAVIDGDVPQLLTSNDDYDDVRCSQLMVLVNPGRYMLRVGEFENDAAIDYTLDVTIDPIRLEGEECDRSSRFDLCDVGLTCLQTEDNGDGICGVYGQGLTEVEPNHTTAEAEALILHPYDTVTAALLPMGEGDPEDAFDVFVLDLETESMVTAWTHDGEGGCDFDTVLYRVDGAALDANADLAILDALEENDDINDDNLCSLIEEVLPAGRHYYLIEEIDRDDAIAEYAFTVAAAGIVDAGGRCDPQGDVSICSDESDCVDIDGNGDGQCLVINELDGDGDYAGSIDIIDTVAVFAFALDGHARLTAETNDGDLDTCPDSTDTKMFVYRIPPTGPWQQIYSNDDGGNSACSRLVDVELDAGVWAVVVNEFGDNATIPAFTLSVDFTYIVDVGGDCDDADPDFVCAMGTFCSVDAEDTCVEHVCGDGVRWMGQEACDDGNNDDGDGCSANCETEGTDAGDGGEFAGGLEAGETAYYAFTVEERSFISGRTSNPAGACGDETDTILTLYEVFDGETPFELASNDDIDSPDNLCSAVAGIVEAGRYIFEVSTFENAALAAYAFELEILPVVDEGGDCDRALETDRCDVDLYCALGDEDGTGVCKSGLYAGIAEVEPNQTRADVMDDAVAPGTAIIASIDGFTGGDDDLYDVFVLHLDEPSTVIVQTGDGQGGCPGDTVLDRIDPDLLGDDGDIVAALTGALAESDNFGPLGDCSALIEELPAGDHYYAVTEFGSDQSIDPYVVLFDATPIRGQDGLCDMVEQESTCDVGLICVDLNHNNDGHCQDVQDASAGGDFPGVIPLGAFDSFLIAPQEDSRYRLRTREIADNCVDADTVIEVLRIDDDSFDRVGFNDDGDDFPCSELEVSLMGGAIYMVVIIEYSRDEVIDEYTLIVEMLGGVVFFGDECDRSGNGNPCDSGLICRQGPVDGTGICDHGPGSFDFASFPEDNDLPDAEDSTANAVMIGAGSGVLGTLEDMDDEVDVFAVMLDAPAIVTITATGSEGPCNIDTLMFRVDGAVLDADGVDAAIEAALAEGDDEFGLCAQLTEELGAGTHYYLVHDYLRNSDIDYSVVVDIAPVLPVGERCDAFEVDNVCGAALACVDDNDDNDGICTEI